jgi:protein TonB
MEVVMFATLLESGFHRDDHEGSISVSALLHVAFMCGGVLLSQGRSVDDTEIVPRDTLIFIDPAPRPELRPVGPGGGGGRPSVPFADPTFVIAIDLPSIGNPLAVDTFPTSAAIGLSGSGLPTSGSSGESIFASATVEKPALPLPGNKPPAYPEILRTAGVEGSVLMHFVIDTAGWVEPSSIIVMTADHDLFASSARVALLRHRFLPAEVAGRRVRMLVEQRFEFAIQR